MIEWLLVGFVGFAILLISYGILRTKRNSNPVKRVNNPDPYTNEIGIILDEKRLGWAGSTPFVEFDENFVQMPLTRTELKIPREHTTRMTYLAWFSGFIAGARGLTNLKMWLIIIIILVIVTAGLSYFSMSGSQSGIGFINATLNDINNKVGEVRNIIDQPRINNTPVV